MFPSVVHEPLNFSFVMEEVSLEDIRRGRDGELQPLGKRRMFFSRGQVKF
jgi:hypothetical protein